MPSDLSPCEKEEKEVERLINKKPAPSRKTDNQKGPKFDNRRTRMKQDDPDLGTKDKDMSMNYKQIGSIGLLAIAQMVVSEAEKKPGKKRSPKKKPEKSFDLDFGEEYDPNDEFIEVQDSDILPEKTLESRVETPPEKPKKPSGSGSLDSVERLATDVANEIRDYSPAVAKSFSEWALTKIEDLKVGSSDDINNLKKEISSVLPALESKVQKSDVSGIPTDSMASRIASMWPKDEKDWSTRAAIIYSLKSSTDDLGLPSSFKKAFLSGETGGDGIVDSMISDAGKFKIESIEDGSLSRFTAIASAYKFVSSNPLVVEESKLSKFIDDSSEDIMSSVKDMAQALVQMSSMEKIMANFKPEDESGGEYQVGDDFSKALQSLDGLFRQQKPIVDKDELLEKLESAYVKEYDLENGFMKQVFASSVATSYGFSRESAMVRKTSQFHGVSEQGHPSGPTNTVTKSYDSRYFGKEHYASILKSAKAFLSEDWLKDGWGEDLTDARFRSALDLAIYTADSCLYQSKIDPGTYDMLLNQLAGWDHDPFVDTVLPTKSTRSASTMKPAYEEMIHIANDLRKSNPDVSLRILASVRDFVAQDQESGEDLDADELKKKDKALLDAKDMDDFIAGIEDLQKTVTKTSSFRLASSGGRFVHVAQDMTDLSALEDMTDDEVKTFLDQTKSKVKEMDKNLSSDDLDKYLAIFDELIKGVGDAAKEVKTSSARVNLATLVRVAASSSAARAALMPFLITAKKKLDKKKSKTSLKKEEKPSKKEEKKEEKKGPPKPAKKDEKSKKSPVGKKRKSSYSVDSSDTDW